MTNKARILVIEDETPVAMMMTSALSHFGCDVLVANTGEKGMALAREREFDLIAVESNLPDTSPFEICSELKQRHISSKTPIVFVSGRPSEEELQKAFEAGAVDYFAKPFDLLTFVSRVLSHVKVTA